eukprot:scaffold334095_cov51-Attheya_sp.AAC.1
MAEPMGLRIARQSTISRPTRTRGTSMESADDGASYGLCMCSGQKCDFLRRYGVHFTSFDSSSLLLHTLFKSIMDHRGYEPKYKQANMRHVSEKA